MPSLSHCVEIMRNKRLRDSTPSETRVGDIHARIPLRINRHYPFSTHDIVEPPEEMNSDMLMPGPNRPGESMMTTFAVTKQRRATRAKFAKLMKTTGKRRHVKCDETKPCCKNCIKWAGFCSGYESLDSQQSSPARPPPPAAGSRQHNSNHQAVKSHHVRRQTNDAGYVSSGYVSSSPSPLGQNVEPVSATIPGQPDDGEHMMRPRYGRGQTDDTESRSSGYVSLSSSPLGQGVEPVSATTQGSTPQLRIFDDTFWKETMPRLVRDSTAVRYANIAVHTLMSAKSPTLIHSGDTHHHAHYRSGGHYGAALTCYGNALREARTASASRADLREAILCSMFFVIFETINGDQAAAEAHLQSGQRILDELGRARARARDQYGRQHGGGGGGGEAESRRRQLRYVLQFLAVQARDLRDTDGPGHGGLLDDFPES
ncbi:hypothetical protein TOPH_02463 [Tolypocladium ophioglossoides CBS 100239]|uniref:Zn(2)-C6 fungal-type domain-containing protein n=1 Tax=Tolypocladium ophioglossoides (strain CBS 100239) TaxID=1163406 RepID=A0A0L0NFZ4_TOLOC|nr:hypothetical protein TOPH_02463 [Tolypocladium ophioglossoides CBS 100239]